MKPAWGFLALLSLSCCNPLWSSAQTSSATEAPPVIAPPDSFFELVHEEDRDAARAFYKKYVVVKGLPVLASGEVADLALQRVSDIVTHLLAGRPDVLSAMVSNKMYLIVIGKNQRYTDMPEYRHSRNPDYLNERVRGTGGRPTSFGEENVLSLPIDRYDDESIAVHEFCHTIDGTLRSIDPTWTDRRNKVYHDATEKGLWKNTYAGSNPGEFWAEICQSYFDNNRVNNWNHGPIGTRDQLKQYDPESYELVKSTFNLSPEQDWRYTWLQKLPSVIAPPAKFNVDPYYTRFTWAREFTVVGRSASDAALLQANDTIRKMFAYRHDVLKAMIGDGIKLVVLGRKEKLSDLPELKNQTADGVDLKARRLDYNPHTKLLVVPEENVVAGADASSDVIRGFAKALYYVTCLRDVDPNWDNRGRNVQQYEMRVTRLDKRFDEKLTALHTTATEKKLWQGTPAAKDRVEYWAGGVLAYFDAGGRAGTAHRSGAIPRTRAALKEYDPDLYALVHETMAYEGHADWRYGTSNLASAKALTK